VKNTLGIAAAAEAGTGILLLVAPQFVVRLLLGFNLDAGGTAMARIAGIALIGLGVACLPFASAARPGMLVYGGLVTLYLASLSGGPAGPLLWPAVAVHVVLCFLVARTPPKERKATA